MRTLARGARRRDDRGTSLILALVFVFAVSLVLVAVGGLAANALLNTNNNRSQRTATEDAENAINIAMQYVRYHYVPPTSSTCLPAGAQIPSSDPRNTHSFTPVQVYCTQDISPISNPTRIVNFYGCAPTVSYTGCTVPSAARLVFASVAYNDLNPQGQDLCNPNANTSCGLAMRVTIWDVTGADS